MVKLPGFSVYYVNIAFLLTLCLFFILGMTQATSDLIVMVALGKPPIKEVKMDQLQKLQKLQNLQPWPFTRQGQDDAH